MVRQGGPWAIALVCIVLGFMLSLQWKARQEMGARDVAVSLQRAQELTTELTRAMGERRALEQEVKQLRAQLAEGGDREALAAELSRLELAAGFTAVKGPGVRVLLEDAQRPFRPGEDPNAYILHDEDLLKVVNELRAGGAEAISVNGQRLTATSEIRCVGPTVIINGVRTAPPVEILAIGDPQVLEASLRLRGGVIDYLNLWGIQSKVIREQHLTVPAFAGAPQFEFATPAG